MIKEKEKFVHVQCIVKILNNRNTNNLNLADLVNDQIQGTHCYIIKRVEIRVLEERKMKRALSVLTRCYISTINNRKQKVQTIV